MMWRALAAFAMATAGALAWADGAADKRMKALADELRCLVCQNQTIADSNAPLALDLREQIRTQIAQGRDDDQIRAYMVERYGDFVLYNPPLKATTLALWLGPFMVLGLGGFAFYAVVRRHRAATDPAPAPPRRAQIESLLDGHVPPVTRELPSAKRARPKRG